MALLLPLKSVVSIFHKTGEIIRKGDILHWKSFRHSPPVRCLNLTPTVTSNHGCGYLLQAEVQCVSRHRNDKLCGFEVTQGQRLTGNDVVTNQLIDTTELLPFLELHIYTHTHTHTHTSQWYIHIMYQQPYDNHITLWLIQNLTHYMINIMIQLVNDWIGVFR